MAQTYKLRLSDGTQLVVDHAGLQTWTADEQAMVQSSAWRGWRLLREVLAEEARPPKPGDGLGIIPFKKQAPPTLNEMPSLRLADTGDDEEVDGDVYDGYDEPGVLSFAWLWMKRLVVTGALAVGGFYAYLTWETWLPRAGEFGRMVIAEIESHTKAPRPPAPSLDEAEQQARQEALRAAAEQIPHLNADTVEKVMASSLAGVLDPPEVFRRAHDAAERGTAALSTQESQELSALRQNVVVALSASERERLREYDLARGVRVTMPFEDRAALDAVARGVRALSPTNRGRLQALSAKAVAAGLTSSETRAVAAR